LDQAKTLFKAAKGERLEALYILMLTTGIRPGEAMGLPWANVDLDAGKMTISQALTRRSGGNTIGEGKTGRGGWRTLGLPAPVIRALKAHQRRQEQERKRAGERWQDHGLVFCTPIGTPLDPDNQRRAFAELTERAGLGRWHPHELRHSAASLMLQQEVPLEVVSDVLGHKSIRITKDVYGHIGDQQRHRATDVMARALLG
jgi:integrase